jgi:cytochrome c553
MERATNPALRTPSTLPCVTAGALAGCLFVAHAAGADVGAAGERLAAARCVPCHAATERSYRTTPLLEGQPKAAFLAQWRDFRDRKRTAPVMVSLAAELTEQDVDMLAEYYAGLAPPRDAGSSGSEAGRSLADRLRCGDCHGPELRGSHAGAARLAGQKEGYTVWSLQQMRGGARSHGTSAKPDPLLASLTNAEIESLAAHFASLR